MKFPLATKQLSQSDISRMPQNASLSRLVAQNNTLFQQSFERIIGLFATLSFQDQN